MRRLIIEATKPDGSYQVVWVGREFENALEFLRDSRLENRLELWSREHAGSPKGFAPMAYRATNDSHVMVSNTLRMLLNMGGTSRVESIVE